MGIFRMASLFKKFQFITWAWGREMWSRGLNVATTAHVEIGRQHHVSGIELGSSCSVASVCRDVPHTQRFHLPESHKDL